MAEKLKIIPLGGLDEIGKNVTVLEYGKDMIVIDCGVGFPDEEMYGVDLVIPDFTYLTQNAKKLRGLFVTHGHEDHIGSIPYLMQQVNCPIHGTAMTNGLIRLKLEEHSWLMQSSSSPTSPATWSRPAVSRWSSSMSTTPSPMRWPLR